MAKRKKREEPAEPEMPPDMSGDGADMEHAPAESGACENGNGRTYEKPLRVKGAVDDVLRAAMRPKPKK